MAKKIIESALDIIELKETFFDQREALASGVSQILKAISPAAGRLAPVAEAVGIDTPVSAIVISAGIVGADVIDHWYDGELAKLEAEAAAETAKLNNWQQQLQKIAEHGDALTQETQDWYAALFQTTVLDIVRASNSEAALYLQLSEKLADQALLQGIDPAIYRGLCDQLVVMVREREKKTLFDLNQKSTAAALKASAEEAQDGGKALLQLDEQIAGVKRDLSARHSQTEQRLAELRARTEPSIRHMGRLGGGEFTIERPDPQIVEAAEKEIARLKAQEAKNDQSATAKLHRLEGQKDITAQHFEQVHTTAVLSKKTASDAQTFGVLVEGEFEDAKSKVKLDNSGVNLPNAGELLINAMREGNSPATPEGSLSHLIDIFLNPKPGAPATPGTTPPGASAPAETLADRLQALEARVKALETTVTALQGRVKGDSTPRN